MIGNSNRTKTEVMLFMVVIFLLSASTASSTVFKHTSRFGNGTRESQAEIDGLLWKRRPNSSSALLKNYKRLKKKVAGPVPDVER